MIIKCTCQHEGQDKLHGKQMRVVTPTAKKAGDVRTFRCTVCVKEHQAKE